MVGAVKTLRQGSKSPGEFARTVQECLSTAQDSTSQKITLDLQQYMAYLAVGGMSDELRIKFLNSESLRRAASKGLEGKNPADWEFYDRAISFCEEEQKNIDFAKSIERPSKTGGVPISAPLTKIDRDAQNVHAVGPHGECWAWHENGTCEYGDNCRFNHTPKGPAKTNHQQRRNRGQRGGRPNMEGKQDSRIENKVELKSEQKGEQAVESRAKSGSGNFESLFGKNVDNVFSVSHHPSEYDLHWDTAAFDNIAKTLAKLKNPERINETVRGLGGDRQVTHKGHSEIFDMPMKFIRDGNTPNLLSIGKMVPEDQYGNAGFALFGP
jgi:hypothetical protein